MGRAVTGRADYTSGEVRRLARRAKDAAQARRLLAIAAVLDGASRSEAAKIGGMDRQTLRVIRFNDQGPDGLINIPSSGVPPKLDTTHRAFLARIVEEGPTPAIHGVVRWRACDLIMRLHEEFGLAVSDDTIYRALKDLGFSHVSARPKAYKQDTEARGGVQKNFAARMAEARAGLAPDTPIGVWFQDEMRVRNSGFQPTSRSCRCRRAHPNSTAKKISGSSCARIGSPIGSSNPSTTSSTAAATPGTPSSTSHGRSCPSRNATGPQSVTHCEVWYYALSPR
jgi:transposase